MPDLDESFSSNELLQEISTLKQEVAELKAAKVELELLQEVTTSLADDVVPDLDQRNRSIRSIFGHYAIEEAGSLLPISPAALKWGGKRQTVSVLVADLRGFTALSERLAAADVLRMLNCYLGQMTEVIDQYHGTINNLTGDGLMVLFGAPTVRKDDALRAVSCAIAMQLAMSQVNQKMEEWQLPQLQMGIGLNTGEAVVGNIGSEKYAKYSAIGKHVNLAYRIESYTVGGQVLISEQTLEQVRSAVTVDERIQIIPKGLNQPITVFSLKAIQTDSNLALPHEEQLLKMLPQPLIVQYATMQGKQVSPVTQRGQLLRLSSREAELRLRQSEAGSTNPSISEMSDLKINLRWSDRLDDWSDDIYAKVLSNNAANDTVFVYFTTIRPAEADRIKRFYERL